MGHKTFRIFQRYKNPSEEDLREVVTTAPPTRHNTTVGKLLTNGFSHTEETSVK